MSSEIGGGVLHLDNISLVEMRRRKNKKKGRKNQQSSGSLTITPQKYPRIFIIILLYILGMN